MGAQRPILWERDEEARMSSRLRFCIHSRKLRVEIAAGSGSRGLKLVHEGKTESEGEGDKED